MAFALAVVVVYSGCRSKPEPIRVSSTTIFVENQSASEWTQVEVWVNDHYRATAPTLAPGGRLVLPLDRLVAAFGQRFDPRRQHVFGVEVVAQDSSGGRVTLIWGKGRRR